MRNRTGVDLLLNYTIDGIERDTEFPEAFDALTGNGWTTFDVHEPGSLHVTYDGREIARIANTHLPCHQEGPGDR